MRLIGNLIMRISVFFNCLDRGRRRVLRAKHRMRSMDSREVESFLDELYPVLHRGIMMRAGSAVFGS